MVAMNRLQIRVLPDIVNAMVLTAAFSAGNSYVYCASRSLYGLALEGKAPAFLATCTRRGVPVYCVLIVLCFALLSFLQVSNGASIVLQWLVNLVTASQLINYSVICVTYLRFYRAMEAQGVSRDSLPYKGWGPALRRLVRLRRMLRHDFRWRLYGLPARTVGSAELPFLVSQPPSRCGDAA